MRWTERGEDLYRESEMRAYGHRRFVIGWAVGVVLTLLGSLFGSLFW